ncbi:MAG: hypothetical protein ACYTEK_06680 [Planctomycetota bacterium]
MSETRENRKEFARQVTMGVLTNMTTLPLLAGIYFLEAPAFKLASGLGVLLAFEAWGLLIKRLKRTWKDVRPLGSYFLPAAFMLWALSRPQRRPKTKMKVKAETVRLKEIIATWPDASLRMIAGVLDPKRQKETLSSLLAEMGTMRDARLATVTERIHRYLGEIAGSAAHNGNELLFGQVMLRLSSYGPDKYPQTYKRFLELLMGVFAPPVSVAPRIGLWKLMTSPLQNAISQADDAHAGAVREIVARIMADDQDEHETAENIAEMLPELEWEEQREIGRIIFNESLKRAFRSPKHFGIEFLAVLGKLEHRMFWLDIQSLRNILEESLSPESEGLINLNLHLYNELCSRVLAPVEDPVCHGVRHARVFRRLKHDDGRVTIECIGPGGDVCRCEGQSLSFRGIYSKSCRRQAGEKLSMNIIPIREVERRFTVKASVAPLHAYEEGSRGPGRGAFFEEAEPSVVEALYEYVSTRQ